MSVLPTWWIEHVHVTMNMYLGLMSLVTVAVMIIDLPFSYFADRMGAKFSYGLGLCVFALSFVFVAVANSPLFFILYISSNTLTEGLMSGADSALLRSIVGSDDYRKSMYRLSKYFYLLTSVLFFIGVGLYLCNPVILFFLQAMLIFVAGVCILTVTVNTKDSWKKTSNHQAIGLDGIRGLLTDKEYMDGGLRYLAGIIAVCLAYGLFNGYMQFQNRTIQLLSADFSIAGLDSLWTVAIFLFVGNLVTVVGVSGRIEQMLKSRSFRSVTVILLGLLVCSAMLLMSGFSILVMAGYLLVCILKGTYRAEYSDMAMRSSPFINRTATWFSVVNTAANLISALLNFLISLVATDDVASIQPYWLWSAVILALVSIPLLGYARQARLPYPNPGISGKKSYLLFHFNDHESTEFMQTYPIGCDCTSFISAYTTFRGVYGRHMPCINTSRSSANQITYEMISGDNLLSWPAQERMQVLLDSGLIHLFQSRQTIPDTHDGRNYRTNVDRACAQYCHCYTYSHGDMNPGNIIISDSIIILVDWDQMSLAPRLLDEFAILLHPDVPSPPELRIQLLVNVLEFHKPNCPLKTANLPKTIIELIDAKIADCRSWRDSDFANQIIKKYSELKKEFNEILSIVNY